MICSDEHRSIFLVLSFFLAAAQDRGLDPQPLPGRPLRRRVRIRVRVRGRTPVFLGQPVHRPGGHEVRLTSDPTCLPSLIMYVCMYVCRVYSFGRRSSSVLLCLVGKVRLALAIRRIWSAVSATPGTGVGRVAGGPDLITSAYRLWMYLLRHETPETPEVHAHTNIHTYIQTSSYLTCPALPYNVLQDLSVSASTTAAVTLTAVLLCCLQLRGLAVVLQDFAGEYPVTTLTSHTHTYIHTCSAPLVTHPFMYICMYVCMNTVP